MNYLMIKEAISAGCVTVSDLALFLRGLGDK